MTLQEAWDWLSKPNNRFDKDLISLRIIVENQEDRLKAIENKPKLGRPFKKVEEEVQASA